MQSRKSNINKQNNGFSGLPRLSFVRIIVVLVIAMGYASTMAMGPNAHEMGSHLGYEPSWIGIQILFFFSGALALRSLQAGRFGWDYLRSRILTVFPLLTAFTLATIFVIYPLCAPGASFSLETSLGLLKYFILTVSGIDPGRVLPGLLDNAPYACLIQGTIWTFRWGLALHIGTALFGRFPVLTRPRILLTAAVLTSVIYAASTYAAVINDWSDSIHVLTAMRLATPFLMGMTIWAYRDRLPTSSWGRAGVIALCFAAAAALHNFGPWSPMIELFLYMGWGYAAWLLAMSRTRLLSFTNNWPRLTPALYMANWPIAQLLLMGFPELTAGQLVMLTLPATVIIAIVIHMAMKASLFRKIAVQTARS